MQEPDHASGKQMQRCYAKSLAADALLFMQPYSSLCAYVAAVADFARLRRIAACCCARLRSYK